MMKKRGLREKAMARLSIRHGWRGAGGVVVQGSDGRGWGWVVICGGWGENRKELYIPDSQMMHRYEF